jgi:hypothetical protein
MQDETPEVEVPSQPVVSEPAAAARRDLSRWLLGAGAAGLFITLSAVIVAGRLSRPPVEPINAGQATPAHSTVVDQPQTVEQTLLPSWVGRRQPAWAADGSKTVSFSLDAIADVTARTSRARPQLVARCLSRTTSLYLVTGPLGFEPQTGTHTVRVQVDDDPVQSQQWVDSESSQELFAPDGAAMTERLARAQRLRIGFTPFHSKPVTAEFIVLGFDELAPLVTRTCGHSPRK